MTLKSEFALAARSAALAAASFVAFFSSRLASLAFRSPLPANPLRDWIATIPSWPSHFKYRPMREVGLELSELLRDPAGPYRVDIIIALTHSRVPNVSYFRKSLS